MKLPDLPDPKSTPKSRYKERRDWLCEQLDTDSVAILVGNRCQVRNKNINFRFRQDHDFYYYTGFIEPDSVAVIRPGHIHPFALFVLPKDEEAETWFAARTGIKAALETFGADLAFSIDELDTQLPQLFETRENIYLVD